MRDGQYVVLTAGCNHGYYETVEAAINRAVSIAKYDKHDAIVCRLVQTHSVAAPITPEPTVTEVSK